MTRNLYLGADLTPAIAAPSLEALAAANGQILREVTANDFPTRAKGLAKEIRSERPDLVGLQEVALWRTAPPSVAAADHRSQRDHGPLRLPRRTAGRAEQRLLRPALRSRRRPARVRPRGAGRRERQSRRRRARPGDPERGDQRAADDARRDPRPQRRRRADLEPAVGQLRDPARSADPRPAAADRPRLDQRRRAVGVGPSSTSSTPTWRRSTR